MKQTKGFTLIAIILFTAVLAGLLLFALRRNNLPVQPLPPASEVVNITEVPETDYSGWNNYKSSKFNYTFSYPQDWDFLAYKENDPTVIFGSHSLHNYSSTEIKKYMDHGITDWKAFLGEKPAVKIDFSVYSKSINKIADLQKFVKESLAEGAEIVNPADLKIGKLNTFQYKATENLGPTDVPEIHSFFAYPDGDRVIFISLYFWNTDNLDSLKKTAEWTTLVKILSTFKFEKPAAISAECGVCGPEGIHNIEGSVCAEGLVCKNGITTSLSFCVKEGNSAETCEAD